MNLYYYDRPIVRMNLYCYDWPNGDRTYGVRPYPHESIPVRTLSQMELIDATLCNCSTPEKPVKAPFRLVLLLSSLGGVGKRKQKASRSIPLCERCIRKGGVIGSTSIRQSLKSVLTHCAGAILCALIVFSGCAAEKPAQVRPGWKACAVTSVDVHGGGTAICTRKDGKRFKVEVRPE